MSRATTIRAKQPPARSRGTSALLAVLAVTAIAGCDGLPFGPKKSEAPGSEKSAAQKTIIVPVEAELPTRGAISVYHDTNSRVEAERAVDVTSEGTGVCKQILVEEGDTVEKGQVLAELDKQEALASLGEAEIQQLEAKANFERAQQMRASGFISQQDYDAAYFTHERAKETVAMRQVQLRNLTITAPWTGTITKRHIQAGALVSSGTITFSMVDPLSYVLAILVPERIVPDIFTGQTADVLIDAVPDTTFNATVRRINPSVDRDTGKVKILLDFEEDARQYMREAAFARVKLVMATRDNALLVSKDAVLEENTRKFVFVVRPAEVDETEGASDAAPKVAEAKPADQDAEGGGKDVHASPPDDEKPEDDELPLSAVRVDVQVGLEDSAHYEILSGITEEDLVVINGHHSLVSTREGTRVRVTNATDEILAKAGLTTEEALKAAIENRKETEEREGRRGHGGPRRRH